MDADERKVLSILSNTNKTLFALDYILLLYNDKEMNYIK